MLLYISLQTSTTISTLSLTLNAHVINTYATKYYTNKNVYLCTRNSLAVNKTVKVKFKRKGGWMRVFKNTYSPILLKFGYAHRIWILNYSDIKHRYKRYLTHHCMLWITNTLTRTKTFVRAINVRPMDKYTMRGIRFSKFYIGRRQGKISKYRRLQNRIF